MRKWILMIGVLLIAFTPNVAVAQADQLVVEESRQSDTEVADETKEKTKKKNSKGDKEDKVIIDLNFALGLLINIISVSIVIWLIYFRNYHKTEILFTYFSFNLVIFLLTLVMNNVKFSTGAAFGLFAVFSMLRYRTEDISTKDMTYLFIVIAIGLICAIKIDLVPKAVISSILILSTYLLDGNVLIRRQFSKGVMYDNITMIKPENYEALLEDLRQRTGLNVYKTTIVKIDFVRDIAQLEIFYLG